MEGDVKEQRVMGRVMWKWMVRGRCGSVEVDEDRTGGLMIMLIGFPPRSYGNAGNEQVCAGQVV